MLVSLLTWRPGLYSGAESSSHWFPHGASEIASVTRPLLVISRLLGVTLGRIFCSNTQSATPREQHKYSHHDSARLHLTQNSVSYTGSALSNQQNIKKLYIFTKFSFICGLIVDFSINICCCWRTCIKNKSQKLILNNLWQSFNSSVVCSAFP